MTEALVKRNARLGKAILAEAAKKYDEIKQKRMIEQVQATFRALDEIKESETVIAGRKAIFNGRLAALRAGEFDFNPRTGLIAYHDKELESIG